jgi:hypothetical protein
MGHHADKFAETEHGDCPWFLPFGKTLDPSQRLAMIRHLFAVGVDQDVGIDRYHRRPSIQS